MTTAACAHPETSYFAWTVPDPRDGSEIVCMGCTACGQVLSGAVDAQGNDVGLQHRLKPAGRRKTKPKQTVLQKLAELEKTVAAQQATIDGLKNELARQKEGAPTP